MIKKNLIHHYQIPFYLYFVLYHVFYISTVFIFSVFPIVTKLCIVEYKGNQQLIKYVEIAYIRNKIEENKTN